MTPARWHAVKQLFYSALERSPAQRQAYLAERCAHDPGLRQELEELLAHHERSTGLRSRPPLADSLAIVAEQRLHGLVGQHLQHYEIERLIGRGGMGAVYAARDARLGRRVAIKLLPPHLAEDPGRRQRFHREAQAGSRINHPNIVTIHEIGQLDDLCFIVSELVDGDTLEARLAAGPLACDEIVAIAIQLADALIAAHGHGVVHRDLKPSNLMITPRGHLKVLDLGLAKLIDGRGAGPIDSAAESRHGSTGSAHPGEWPSAERSHQTLAGAILGTAPYMSPEQSRGEDVDPRSDLFSVGVVLYQLATGALPFTGASLSDVIHALRHGEPPAIARRDVPAALACIIARCLAKQADARYPSAAALLQALQELAPTRPHRVRWKPRARRAAAVVVFGAMCGVVAHGSLCEVSRPRRTSGPTPPANERPPRFVQITHGAGEELFPSLAPDGSWLVYASRVSGNWDIYRRATLGGEPVNLTRNSAHDDIQPAISPDGTRIAFRSERDGGGLFIMAADGTAPWRCAATGANPAWSADGTELFYATLSTTLPHDRRPGELYAVNLTTRVHRLVAAADATQPAVSPHGYRVAYWGLRLGSGQRDIWTIGADGRAPVAVTNDAYLDWNPVWSPDGSRLYFVSSRGGSMNLWSVAIDERTGAVLGPPVPATIPSSYVAHVAFSASGERMVYAQVQTSANLQRIGFDPVRERVTAPPSYVTHGSLQLSMHDLSPDGAQLVVSARDGSDQEALYVFGVDGVLRRRLTDAHHDRGPRWSPDGQRIAFYSDRSGKYEMWTIHPDGSGLTQVTRTDGGDVYYPVWSPDGACLLYQHRGSGNFVLASAPPWSRQVPERLPQPADIEMFTPWSWSAGGKLVGGLRRRGRAQRTLATYDLATGRFDDVTAIGLGPAVWLNDSQRVLFRSGGTIYVLDTVTRTARALVSIDPDEIETISVAPDNRTIYVTRTTREADLWLAERNAHS